MLFAIFGSLIDYMPSCHVVWFRVLKVFAGLFGFWELSNL